MTDMKRRLLYILAITLTLPLSVLSCRKSTAEIDGEDIALEWTGYIAFESPTESKADNTVNSMVGRDFGVFAYNYNSTTNWNVFKATGKPMPEFDCPQAVTWDGAMHVYDASASNGGGNLVQWRNNKDYTFFAFYPLRENSAGTVAYNTTKSTTNMPSISYTSPFTAGGSVNSTDNMQDVMSTVVYNTDNSNSGTVPFTFKHRLCCFCLEARNFKDTDEELKDVKVTITSPIYKTARIPLDPSSAIETSSPVVGEKVFEIVPMGDPVQIPSSVSGGAMSSATTDLSRGRNIILIPQSVDEIGALSGKLSYRDRNGILNESKDFVVSRSFESGKKYSIILSITTSAVSVAIIESGEWIDQDQDIFFE